MCKQLLEKYQLPLTWVSTLMDISNNVSHNVRPDVKFNQDTMDIGVYVHIKKVWSFCVSDSIALNY